MQWTEKTRRIKNWLVVVAILIAVAALLASRYLVRDLQREEQGKMEIWAKAMEALNQDPYTTPEDTLRNVHRAVNSFVAGAEQFDDLTMLCLEYKGKKQAESARK
jgi:hypothetical protein